jgi:hypothetical protein
MSKVFLAYKTVDLERANVVRKKLELLDVPLFIDQKMIPSDNYLSAINAEIKSAVAVFVLWSEAAVHVPDPGDPPNFVLSEAERGYARGILVAATFEKMALDHIPVPFNLLQAANLSDWVSGTAAANHPEWQKVLQALGKKLNRPGLADLAIALECDDDELKKRFLREYSSDPLAHQIAARLEAVERKAFETRLSSARKRIQQRTKEAEKKVAACRDLFEAQITELRAGRDFMLQLDPIDVLGDDDNAKILESERFRADQAEDHVAKVTHEIVELKDRLATDEATLAARNATIGELNSELAKSVEKISNYQSTITSQASEIERITETARQTSEARDGRISELETLTATLKERHGAGTKRLVIWTTAAATVAAIAFGLGMLMTSEPKLASLTAQNQTSLADLKSLRARADEDAANSARIIKTLKEQNATLITQNQGSQDQVLQLKKQISTDATEAAALKSQNQALQSQNQALQKQIGNPLTQYDGPALKDFTIRTNRDIFGSDIPTSTPRPGFGVPNINECALRCTQASSCVALSFDRWNSVCYLKNNVTTSNIDVRSVIAVRKPQQVPNVSTGKTSFEPLPNRKLRGDLIGRSADTAEACKAKCDDDSRCLGFNFLKQSADGNACDTFSSLYGHDPDNTVDAGYKKQDMK